MRCHSIRRSLSCAAVAVVGFLGSAQAAILGFESIPPNLFINNDTFFQGAYGFTVHGDFALVGTAGDFFIAQPPSGNDTQFYSAFNDGSVALARTDGVGFNLYGFDAGFITPAPQDPGVVAGRISLVGTTLTGATVFNSFDFGTSGADGSFAFRTFGDGLGSFRNLTSVNFFACVYDASFACVSGTDELLNLAQFSIDNIKVVAVPEPSSYALLALGLLGVAAYTRRARRS